MITIRKATSNDIYFLSELINIAANAKWQDDYRKKVAEEVCLKEDVTYSWKNGLIASTEDGEPVGGVFAYKGIVYDMYFEKTIHAFSRLYAPRELPCEKERFDRETNTQEFHFESLAVLPQYRRRGIATALINEVKKLYEASDCERLTLAVETDNPAAIKLYQKLGFVDMYNITTVGSPYRKMGIGKWFNSYKIENGICMIDNGVQHIYDFAFQGCTDITKLVLPSTVIGIGTCSFGGCSNLQEIFFEGEGLDYTEAESFGGCTSLESVKLPESTTYVGVLAFKDCTSLREIHLPHSLNTFYLSSLVGCTELRNIYSLIDISNNNSTIDINEPLYLNNCNLHVPKGRLRDYQQSYFRLCNFRQIIDDL